MKSRMRWVGHVACMGERCIHGTGGKTWGKEPLGRPRNRWEDNIKMDLQEVGWWGRHRLDWSDWGQTASTCKCGNEPLFVFHGFTLVDINATNSKTWRAGNSYTFQEGLLHSLKVRGAWCGVWMVNNQPLLHQRNSTNRTSPQTNYEFHFLVGKWWTILLISAGRVYSTCRCYINSLAITLFLKMCGPHNLQT